jgi:hypothetical protein
MHLKKCKENSEKIKQFYKKNGMSEKQKEFSKKLREHGHYKLNIRVTHPNGTTQEFLYNYTNFMNELNIDGEYFTMLTKGQIFKIKRRIFPFVYLYL